MIKVFKKEAMFYSFDNCVQIQIVYKWMLYTCTYSICLFQKALELLCNIFLNFAVIEPGLVRKSDHLINVTIVVMEAVPIVG